LDHGIVYNGCNVEEFGSGVGCKGRWRDAPLPELLVKVDQGMDSIPR
jgi:hypothetical protein